MKNILIVAMTRHNDHLELCENMISEAKLNEESVTQPLGNTWLLSGPNCFETASRLLEIARGKNLPVAVFEIESVLVS